MEAYLDNNATTPMTPGVREAMRPYFHERFGNPHSIHELGLQARRDLETSRRRLAGALNVEPEGLIFTSGGTESDNLAIFGAARARRRRGSRIVTTAVEHPAVLEPCRVLEQDDWDIVRVAPDTTGRLAADAILEAVDEETVLVSVMAVNNELGTIHPVEEIGTRLRRKAPDCLFHVDGVQAVGKVPLDLSAVDLFSLSGHKVHGPRGTGALYVRPGVRILPVQVGGGQEKGLRSGTVNVAGAVGLSVAVEEAVRLQPEVEEKLTRLRNLFLSELTETTWVLNGPDEAGATASGTINIAFPGLKGEILLHALEARGVFVSTGSACASTRSKRSHVLEALGLPDERIEGSIRISMSRLTTRDACLYAARQFREACAEVRV